MFVIDDRKFVIAHETGHRIARIRDGDNKPLADQGAAVNGCDGYGDGSSGHGMVTKEWQSTAIKEGFANFMAAWTWNDEESDCDYFQSFPIDIDLDTDVDANEDTISCEGVPLAGLESYVTSHDWLMDLVAASDPAGCTTPTDWRASEYDVLRYFWDMYTDENVPVGELMDIYDDTDPRNWPPTYDPGVAYNNGLYRLYVAAYNNGYSTAHTNQWDNGVDHW